MTKFKALSVLGATLLSTLLLAQPAQTPKTPKNFYVGVSTVLADSYDTGSFVLLGRSTVGVLGGVTLLREGNFEGSVEGRYLTDFSNFFDTYSYGVYAKPSYNIGVLNTYALLGYSYESGTSRSQDGVSYGGGVDFGVMQHRMFMDYIVKHNTSDDAVTIGMMYKF